MKTCDIAVIGAGPGGYVAAIKAAQMGKKVALIEKGFLGGTCLNVGCIPTKTLIANSHLLRQIQHAAQFGIVTGEISFDYSKMKLRKDEVVQNLRKGVQGLIQSNGIELFRGHAKFQSPNELKITGEDNLILRADKIIIATGSDPYDIGAFPCDHKKIFNSTSILDITELPKTIAVIGAGYIGCEFASLFAAMNVKVILLEALPKILPMQGQAISEAMHRIFTDKGMDIQTNVVVQSMNTKGEGVMIHLAGNKEVHADIALVSVGRKLITDNLDLEKAGVPITEKGAIEVNSKMETSVPGIYAIGDITAKAMLAHVASHQGMVAATNAVGVEAHIHYHAVPAVVFTEPEIATVGLSLEEAIEKGYSATVGRFPFQALGKAQATKETEGFAQVVTDKNTGQVLGAQVIGSEASTLIAEMTLAIQNELTLDCVIDTIHAHPTVAEVWLEAALMANETPVHFPPKKKK